MRRVRLGGSPVETSCIGLGCMGMSEFYGQGDDAESLRVLARALDLGVTMLDTSDLYGKGENERLIGRFLKDQPRDAVVVATKFGVVRDPDGPAGSTYDRDLDNSPTYLRACCEASLKRLGIEAIDLYYVHRYDPRTPIEDVVGAMADLVREGKIRAIGLSEVGVDVLRRAHAVHPIAALQSEYSLFSRSIETDILLACRELGIAFLPWGPLGRGVLTGTITSAGALDAGDLRRAAPAFQDETLAQNLRLLDHVRVVADRHGATLGQVAIAWLLAQGDDIVPIPGTKRIKYLEENVGAASLALSDDEVAALSRALTLDAVAGPAKWDTTSTSGAPR